MAISPSHKFGQIIGDVLEASVLPLLTAFASEHGLYLDKKGHRSCRKGVKCSWTDLNGNTHDLDFVLERGGTDYQRGTPVAFIETAWRRYTKHSRNKAQEIQGAIEPLAETFSNAGPFKGAILAGTFTEAAIEQLKSLGFAVLFFPYQTVITAFQRVSLDASFDENTPDATSQGKVDQWNRLSDSGKVIVHKALLEIGSAEVEHFTSSLTSSVARKIKKIVILPLHGNAFEVSTASEAIALIDKYQETQAITGFERYEIQITFTNGNEITGKFNDKASANEFLSVYRPVNSKS